MQLIQSVTENIVDEAFKKVELFPEKTRAGDGNLYSAGLDTLEAALSDVWEKITSFVGEVSRKGWESMREAFANIVDEISKTVENLGKKAALFREHLLAKIREVISETFELVLAALHSSVKIGGEEYKLATVELEHKLVYTGSIEVSLASLCSFVGTGELVVKGSYSPVHAMSQR